MEDLFKALNVFTYGLAIIGSLLALFWIYNSTIKERRGVLRRAGKTADPALKRIVNQGVLIQRFGFSAAAFATGVAILWFARGYYQKYHVNVAAAYLVLAGVLIGLGIIGALLSYLFRPKE